MTKKQESSEHAAVEKVKEVAETQICYLKTITSEFDLKCSCHLYSSKVQKLHKCIHLYHLLNISINVNSELY